MQDAFGYNIMVGEKVGYFGGGGSGSDRLTPAIAEVISMTDKTAKIRILSIGRDYKPCVRLGQEVNAVPSRLVSIGSLM